MAMDIVTHVFNATLNNSVNTVTINRIKIFTILNGNAIKVLKKKKDINTEKNKI